jgi:hypothetical protein
MLSLNRTEAMSADGFRRNIQSVNNELITLHNRLASERSKEADYSQKLARAQGELNRAKNSSVISMKASEIERLHHSIGDSKRRQANITQQIADKEKRKHGYEIDLIRAQKQEQKDFQREQERNLKNYRLNLNRNLQVASIANSVEDKQLAYDVFISHAFEDKEPFVSSLATRLSEKGISVWYDQSVLTVGDSLRKSIDKGLANSRFGIVVLSKAFFAKGWTEYELNGLVSRENTERTKVILPIWHEVSKDTVLSYSPSLADKVALNTGLQTMDEIVSQLTSVISNPS